MGTTGAAMLLIRPLLQANDNRRHKVHVVVFFIFLVSNIGGSLTPLGDPPLFLGFLKGVDFFWTAQHICCRDAAVALLLLAIFYVLDSYFYARERPARSRSHDGAPRARHRRRLNILLLGGVVGAVLLSGIWKPGHQLRRSITSRSRLQNLVRDVLLVADLAAVAEAHHAREPQAAMPSAGGPSWRSPSCSPASS